MPQVQSQPDLREMAQRLALSKGTISKVLNGRPGIGTETRQRVLKAAKHYGYIPNRQAQILRHGRTRCIQMQVPTLADLNYTEQLEDIYAAAARHGYDVNVTTFERDIRRRERLCRDAIAHRMEAVIVMGGVAHAPMQMLREAGIAVLAIDCGPHCPDNVAVLDTDISEGMRQITAYLLGLGHRRLMMADHFFNDSRYMDGVRMAMRQAGLKEDYVVIDTDRAHPIIPAMHEKTLKVLLENPQAATAILCVNDQIAISTMAAVWDAGLSVPGDISVAGAGNIKLAQLNRPALTTMSATNLHFGEHAVEMLMSIIKGECAPNVRKVLMPELVVRQSTGPAKILEDQEVNCVNVTGGSAFSGGLS